MTLRDDLLPVFGEVARQIPVDLGLRTAVVKRLIIESSGTHVGAGADVVADSLTITPKPKVRVVPSDQNQLTVGPITPRYGSKGYTPEDLNPRSLTSTQRLVYEVTGPQTTERYRLVEINTTRAFGYTLTLETLDRQPPGSV